MQIANSKEIKWDVIEIAIVQHILRIGYDLTIYKKVDFMTLVSEGCCNTGTFRIVS